MGGREYPRVLLQDVVDQFQAMIGRFGEHAVVAGDEVYIQPYVYLSLHLVQMRAAGWADADFDEISAVSGAAALFAHQPGTWRPKYGHLFIGIDDRIANATGFGYEWVSFEGMGEAWDLVKASIDAGRSAKGWHWENVLFAGYQEARVAEERKVLALGDGPHTFAAWWTWDAFAKWVALVEGWGQMRLGRHTARVEKKSPEAIAVQVMRDLVAWSEEPPAAVRHQSPEAAFGLAGVEAYAANCADTEAHPDWLACHDVNPQWCGRNASSVYLARVAEAGLFGPETVAHLRSAAQHYRAAYGNWRELYAQLGHGAPEGSGRSRERRLAGASAVRRAWSCEKAGLDEVHEAQSSLGA